MSRDELSSAALVLMLAIWAMLHASTARMASRRGRRWQGLVALLVLPTLPVIAWRAGLRVRAALWVVLLAGWLVLRFRFLV